MNKQLILGSKSPRRSFLLEQGGFSFQIFTLDVDETYDEKMPCHEVPEYLAIKKVKETFAEFRNQHADVDPIMISADSVVVLDDQILGKPKDRDDAIATLTRMSAKVHEVWTGVAIKDQQKMESFSVVTEVEMDALSRQEIERYIDTFEPFDKAGSYGIQDWIGYCKIKQIKGSYSNVMGLPMNEVYHSLKHWS